MNNENTSRLEQYLQAIADGTGAEGLPEPQSRLEEIFRAIATGDDSHCPQPQSRLEAYALACVGSGGGTATPLQEKSITITENGTTEVLPDEGNALSKVTVNTAVYDEEIPHLELTQNGSYAFYGIAGGKILEAFINQITTKDLNSVSNMFLNCAYKKDLTIGINFAEGGCTCENLFEMSSFTSIPSIDFKQTTAYDDSGLFRGCRHLEQIGTIKNLYPKKLGNLFYSNSSLKSVPKFEDLNMSYIHSNSSDIRSAFYSCSNLRVIPKEFLDVWYSPQTAGQSNHFSGMFYGCYILDEINGVIPITGTLTTNYLSDTFRNCHRAKNITLAVLEDGTPYTVNWVAQTLDLSQFVGYVSSSTMTQEYITDKNILAKKVTDATTYEALKNDPDWFTTDVNYSRYNHDSAVNTINSLPDTSAYLAENGGTNTIKFKGASGALTDGGAINTLTEEEIAVATAKGWTVTYA